MTFSRLASVAIILSTSSIALAQKASKEDFQEFSEAVKGVWISETVADGEKVAGYARVSVEEDGNALLIRQAGGGASSVWLVGYDAHEKTISGQLVSSDGTVTKTVLFKEDGQWKIRFTQHSDEGEEVSTSSLAVSDEGDTHRWTNDSGISATYRRLRN